jgi:hypothetical protein
MESSVNDDKTQPLKPTEVGKKYLENNNVVGGRLKSCISQWYKYTSDASILEAVQGYKLEFIDSPPIQMVKPQPYKLSEVEKCAIDAEIMSLLKKQVIEPTIPEPGDFWSNIFSRPKKDGGKRMILDLSKLNQYLTYHHFKMDTFEVAKQLISPDCYMASIDLQDAYYSVPIAREHRKYLKFLWNGTLYQYRALPNGLSSAPRLFTKLLKPPFAKLRSLGYCVVGYIDDTLLIAPSKSEAEKAIHCTAKILTDLGFIIHPKKSVFKPTQEISYLGFVINSSNMTVSLTQDKRNNIKDQCLSLARKVRPTIRNIAEVVGKMVASFPAVQYGQLHYRALELEKHFALRQSHGNFEAKTELNKEARKDLEWWILNIHKETTLALLRTSSPQVQIESDASGLGWGGTDGHENIGGRWNAHELTLLQQNGINFLELLAVSFNVKAFCKNTNEVHVHVKCDNQTTVTYINNMGGTRSLTCNTLAKELWQWCIDRTIWLSASYLPGKLNVTADQRSRKFQDQTEWMLDQGIFQELCKMQGNPEIDLFASRLNRQLSRYISWKPDPDAEATDAFTVNWGNIFFYAFPPFCLITTCLQKIEADKAEGIMVIPRWPTQPWFAKLLHMLVAEPILLPKGVVSQPVSGITHPLHNSLRLLCYRLSGNRLRVKEFRRELCTSFSSLGDNRHPSNIMSTSNDGLTFVVEGISIQCKRM